MPPRTVGLIGVGLVGTALAERWRTAGWNVIGYDTSATQCDALRQLGGEVATDPDAVFRACGVIGLSLPTSDIVTAVLDAITVPLAGKTIIDTTTGDPEAMAAIGNRLMDHGATYLDATIAGSSAQVRTGEVLILVGGDAAAIAACDDLFRSFAAQVFPCGECGDGARMKLVVNLVLGLHRAVLAEGLAFAERTGIDPRQALAVLRAGPTYSRVMDTKGEKMLAGDFTPQARLSQHLKDVRLILSTGATAGAMLPLSTLHEQLLAQLVVDGYGDFDNSAVIKAFS